MSRLQFFYHNWHKMANLMKLVDMSWKEWTWKMWKTYWQLTKGFEIVNDASNGWSKYQRLQHFRAPLLLSSCDIVHYFINQFYVNYFEVMAKNSFWQPFLTTILNNGDSWNCWTCQHHVKWICYVHKHALRPKNHDIMIIISEIMAKNVILQP